jgi:hypothetical protein
MLLSMFVILKCSTEEKGTKNKFKCIRREANENNETQWWCKLDSVEIPLLCTIPNSG